MQNAAPNPCIRCGKQRIVSKEWTEYIGLSLMTRIDTICPDKDCQKFVDLDIEDKRQQRQAIIDRKILSKSSKAS